MVQIPLFIFPFTLLLAGFILKMITNGNVLKAPVSEATHGLQNHYDHPLIIRHLTDDFVSGLVHMGGVRWHG